VDDLFVELRIAFGIVNIPPERLEERVNEFPQELGLIELAPLVGLQVEFETLDESGNDLRDR
jgi:hypothetical protein